MYYLYVLYQLVFLYKIVDTSKGVAGLTSELQADLDGF
jgi:hypothetical protein